MRAAAACIALILVLAGCGSDDDARKTRLAGCRAAGPSYRDSGSPREKAVALTFADGPGRLTPAILKVLRDRGVSATFFVVGRMVPGRKATLRQALAQGSILGNHSFTHANLVRRSDRERRREINRTQDEIRRATGYTPCLLRPPYGSTNRALVSRARTLSLLTIGVGVDPEDWRNPGAGVIYRRVVGGTRSGAIILLHDAGPRGQTLAALPRIISTLRSRGYRLVTLTRLLGLRPRYE